MVCHAWSPTGRQDNLSIYMFLYSVCICPLACIAHALPAPQYLTAQREANVLLLFRGPLCRTPLFVSSHARTDHTAYSTTHWTPVTYTIIGFKIYTIMINHSFPSGVGAAPEALVDIVDLEAIEHHTINDDSR